MRLILQESTSPVSAGLPPGLTQNLTQSGTVTQKTTSTTTSTLQLASRGGRLPPLPRSHRLRVAPQPALRIPRLLLQIPQRRLPARVLLIPPCQPSANKCLVQVPPIRQDDLGGGAVAPINVADLHRDRLSASQSPLE